MGIPIKITQMTRKEPPCEDPLLAAIKAFPAQMVEAMKTLPAPIIAPRNQGCWIIDVARNPAGQMSRMSAKFHETK